MNCEECDGVLMRALRADNARLRADLEVAESRKSGVIVGLKAENARLREALEWYASEARYTVACGVIALLDKGAKARAALEPADQHSGVTPAKNG